MRQLKLSTARNLMVFMVGAADHITGLASLTLTITASKDGAAFASISPTVTDRGNGWYNIALTTSHTDTLGDLALHITGTAADPLDLAVQVVTELPGDNDAWSTVLADSVPAVGSRPTPRQALLMASRVFNTRRRVVGTTLTLYKEDGVTASMTYTLDANPNASDQSRAT